MMLALALVITGATVVDGDTFRADGQRYRLFGIDAPDRGEPGFAEASDALRGLIGVRRLYCTVVDRDRFQRDVVICLFGDGRDLACEMVAAGHARDWPRYSGGDYAGCGQ